MSWQTIFRWLFQHADENSLREWMAQEKQAAAGTELNFVRGYIRISLGKCIG